MNVGDEMVSDSESDGLSDLGEEYVDPNVNTLHYQRDGLFAAKYFYITDVCWFFIQCVYRYLLKGYIRTLFFILFRPRATAIILTVQLS